jgi:hypothetical protein
MAKKKYSINWEDDVAVSFEVNGVTYESLDDVPDEKDRGKLEAMMDSADDAEFEAEAKAEIAKAKKELERLDKVPFEKIILSVFTGVAVLMLSIAGIASVNNILKINREESVMGRVVDMTKRLEYDEEDRDRVIGEAYFPVVDFVSKDGKPHTVQLSEGSFPPAHEVGEEVIVLYEPEHPLDARIKSFGSSVAMWILPSITGILGIAFLGAVIAVRKLMPSEE